MFFEQLLGLFVELGALLFVSGVFGGRDQFVELGVAPLGEVVAIDRVAAEQGAEPVVRITVVAAPANQHRAVFTAFGALDVLAPFVGHDLGLDADLAPVRLQHLSHQLGVRVVRALNGHGPQGDFGAFLDACFLEQLLGFFRVVGRVFDRLVIGPLGRRQDVGRQLACALIHRINDLLFVYGHVQCLANLELRHRVGLVAAFNLVHHVVGDVTRVEACLAGHLQVGVFFEGLQVCGARVNGDLAFVLFQLLHAHRRVGGDGENQVVDFDVFRLPVVFVAGVTDVRIFLVALEHERAGADGFLVDVGRVAGLEQLVGVFGRLDGGKVHGHVLDKGRVDFVQSELDGVVVDFFD